MKYCPYCESAKKLLKSKGYPFDEILLPLEDGAAWDELEKKTGFKTMPQIFVGEQFVGGFNELDKLNRSGELEKWVA